MTISPSIQYHFSLRHHNTFGVDAQAYAYVEVASSAVLASIRSDNILSALPRLVLGGGSNIVLTQDFPGLVMHMGIKGIEIVAENDEFTFVRAAAGENWHQLVLWTLDHALGGLENLSLIPGSVGAAPIQNIGAYGVEARDYIHGLRVYDFDSGEIIMLNNADCRFGYRDSIFKQDLRSRCIVLDVTFALPKRWQANVGYADVARKLTESGVVAPCARDVSEAVIAIRTAKLPDPAVIGNAGSFFKNPIVTTRQRDALLDRFPGLVSYRQSAFEYKLAAGWLIDQCGWKGRKLGAAGVYEKQALVLVNRGDATGADIVQLADAIQKDVLERFGVQLEPEPVYV
ncbi:UDP-N-acetylmuramate dehydrogenase [Herminiimonas sp. CN]|uniref:UDP-N-acetylmuramate dehydrogenase n=1 Tax=Herminiimonas sp. CN TaxID=1349818 RepID=UPI000474442F|nr:UDP-N-acetylmuramate dehydrogenase [Herminiimonas sp. CN]